MDIMPSSGFGSIWTMSVLFGFIYSNIADEYSWNCTANDKGQKRIPDLDVYASHQTDISNRNTLYIFSLPHLNASCYGTITAIDYCYQYDGNAVDAGFNWTVLILNDQFTIVETFHIESHSATHQSYGTSVQGMAFHCATMHIDGFELPRNNFYFGVTDSAEGSGASLLAFHDSLYMVDVILMPRDNLKLNKGSTISTTEDQLTQRGVRCLWFVINTDPTASSSSDQTTTSTPDNHGLNIGIGVAVALGILTLIGGVIIVAAVALIVNKLRKNPPVGGEVEAPLALGDWVDPQTQKGA